MKKRTLILASLLLSAAVVSCGEATGEEPASSEPASTGPSSSEEISSSAEESGTETEAETEEPGWKSDVVYTVYREPNLPADLTFEGETFRFSLKERNDEFMFTEGLNGEVINDTTYARNLQVEERFGIKLEGVLTDQEEGNLRAIVDSGSTEFDMVYGYADILIGVIPSGYALDMCNIPYIDFSEEFWFPELVENFSCYDKVFMAPSDIATSILGNTIITYFNKRILGEYDLQSPYQMVYDNTWTLDNFLTMVRKVSKDLNGDGVMDHNDLYGIGVISGRVLGTFANLLMGCDVKVTVHNEDRSLSFDPDGEKIQLVIDKCAQVLKDRSLGFDEVTYGQIIHPEDPYYTPLFEQGHYLFELNYINCIQKTFREMEDDFGIAPLPKYDEYQENYHHRPSVLVHLFSVPSTAVNLDKVGAVFSYMSWLSSQTVLPAYYEVTLKQKRTRDEDSARMLDLIHNTIYYDWPDIMTNIRWYMVNAYEAGSYERVVATSLKKLNKALNQIQNKLRDLD
ncbi:MAG: hypothetical protein II719_00705 [Clostridia bacterium]|nr:hypothetical protein [Clostridia bacterium]